MRLIAHATARERFPVGSSDIVDAYQGEGAADKPGGLAHPTAKRFRSTLSNADTGAPTAETATNPSG
jgi:hypothetical protein